MAQFIQLTDLKGQTIWIGTAWIQAVQEPDASYLPTTGAVIVLSGERRGVKETVKLVMEKL